MPAPEPELGKVTTPSKGYTLAEVGSGPTLTDWHVTGEVRCPDDCGRHFDLDCSLDELVKFTALHECEVASDG